MVSHSHDQSLLERVVWKLPAEGLAFTLFAVGEGCKQDKQAAARTSSGGSRPPMDNGSPRAITSSLPAFNCPLTAGIGDSRLCSSVRSGVAYGHPDQIGLVQGQST